MEKIFEEIKQKIIIGEWVKGCANGKGNVGLTLEKLLDKERENFELPDYKGIELKTKYSKKEEYITLFCAAPDSYLFEIKRLKDEYGYPDIKYPQFNIFNLSVYGNRKIKLNNKFFKLFVDYENKKVVLKIYNNNDKLIDSYSSWSFEILKEKLERKLRYLAFIRAERKFELNTVYFKYNKIDFYKLISFEKFLLLVEKGIIRITFRIGVYKKGIKFGEVYDHGTCFSIKESDLSKLFDNLNQ